MAHLILDEGILIEKLSGDSSGPASWPDALTTLAERAVERRALGLSGSELAAIERRLAAYVGYPDAAGGAVEEGA